MNLKNIPKEHREIAKRFQETIILLMDRLSDLGVPWKGLSKFRRGHWTSTGFHRDP